MPTTGISIEGISRALLGLFVLVATCYLLSSNRRHINWKLVGSGILIQIIFCVVVLNWAPANYVLQGASNFFVEVMNFTEAGATMIFGPKLMDQKTWGVIFAFHILPTIIFFSALSTLLYYLGILQKIVYVFAWAMSKTMRLSGAESLAAAANIFVGQTEAPLVVKPYLANMTKSEILCLMIGGMGTIAGGVFAAFVGYLGGGDEDMERYFALHLLTASIMSAPACIVAAKMLYPEIEPDKIDRTIKVSRDRLGANVLDAITSGTTDGVKLAVNVGAMLLVFTALIFMVNYFLGEVGGWLSVNDNIAESTGGLFSKLSLDYILGVALSPVAWLLGVPWDDCLVVGQLLGKKTILNEFVAYSDLALIKDTAFKHTKSILITTYALCGFANFASIGIQIGGIGVLAPNQRQTLARFGIKALIGGTIATFMTATIAGAIA